MTTKKKAAGVLRAPTATTSKNQRPHFPIIRRIIKAAIVVAALRGWLPYPVADWLVLHGGLAHV